jgi:hypothetical protein
VWLAMCVAPAANGVSRVCAGLVDWCHLARPTRHGRHGRVHADVVPRPVVTLTPQRARPTRVPHVWRRADVAVHDVAPGVRSGVREQNNLLSRFSKLIFSIFKLKCTLH